MNGTWIEANVVLLDQSSLYFVIVVLTFLKKRCQAASFVPHLHRHQLLQQMYLLCVARATPIKSGDGKGDKSLLIRDTAGIVLAVEDEMMLQIYRNSD